MEPRVIRRVRAPLDATLPVPASKSVTHRALVAAALGDGPSVIEGPLDADDTRRTREGLAALGYRVESSDGSWTVHGSAQAPAGGAVALGDSGTSMRFLVALAALGRAPSTLDGSARLRERPVRELVTALRSLGATVEAAGGGGGLPVRAGGAAPRGGAVRVRADRSSQFASALLLIAPALEQGLALALEAPAVSLPYVELTLAVMADFGVAVDRPDELSFVVRPARYRARRYRVEGDHSSASYWLAAGAIAGGRVRAAGIDPASRQPDARLAGLLEGAGAEVLRGPDWIEVRGGRPLRAFDLDLGGAPDLVPTVAVLAMFAAGRSRLRNIGHLRVKESDRLETLAANLRRLGCPAEVRDEGLEIFGDRERLHGALVVTASDHRMAMALALAGLAVDGVAVDDPSCVSKSNPDFWDQFEKLEATRGR